MTKQSNDFEDQADFDTEAAVADIATDLFGQGGTGADAPSDAGAGGDPAELAAVDNPPSQPTDKTGSEDPAVNPPAEASPSQSPEENSDAVQETGAPKTWSKEALAEWATLPPRAQQEILKREEDFFRGISMYKQSAEIGDRYSKVVEPYAPILAAEKIDPVELFSSFAANHYLLTRGTEAQKLELAANMIQGYGIDFSKLVSFIGERSFEPADPEIESLRREIADLKSAASSTQQREQAAVAEKLAQEIDAFAKDPANPFFEEVVDDIVKLFQAGQASNLKEAYDKAVYLNPNTRQKELDRLTAERAQALASEQQGKVDKIARTTAADLSLDPKARNGTVPLGTLDETLAETMARIASRA